MKIRKYIAGLIALFIIIILYFNINTIIVLFYEGDGRLKEIEFDGTPSNSRVIIATLSMDYQENALNTLSVSGWALCKTEFDNQNKVFGLVLKGRKRSYITYVAPGTRRDVYGDFGNSNVGLNTAVSTAHIRNDTYDIYIYCKENEYNYGLVYTGNTWIKKGKKFVPTETAQAPNWPHVDKTNEMKYYLDNKNVSIADNSILTISGWAYIDGLETENQEIYLELKQNDTMRTFRCNKLVRRDVVSAFKSEKYFLSGFTGDVPLSLFDKGIIDISVIIKNDRICYKSMAEFNYQYN